MVYFSGMRPTATKMLRIFYFVVLKLYNVKIKFVGIDISVVNSTYCSCKGQEHGGSQIRQMTTSCHRRLRAVRWIPPLSTGACMHILTPTHRPAEMNYKSNPSLKNGVMSLFTIFKSYPRDGQYHSQYLRHCNLLLLLHLSPR